MDKEYLTNLMRKVAEGNTKPEEAVEILKDLPLKIWDLPILTSIAISEPDIRRRYSARERRRSRSR